MIALFPDQYSLDFLMNEIVVVLALQQHSLLQRPSLYNEVRCKEISEFILCVCVCV